MVGFVPVNHDFLDPKQRVYTDNVLVLLLNKCLVYKCITEPSICFFEIEIVNSAVGSF